MFNSSFNFHEFQVMLSNTFENICYHSRKLGEDFRELAELENEENNSNSEENNKEEEIKNHSCNEENESSAEKKNSSDENSLLILKEEVPKNKGFAYGKIIKVKVLNKSGSKTIGFNLYLRYHKVTLKLGPYKNYEFIYAVKTALLEQLRSMYLNKNPKYYKKIIIPCFRGLKDALYDKFPPLKRAHDIRYANMV